MNIMINRILLGLLIVASFIWLIIPFGMAILWSLVDPDHAWSYPDILPPVLSFGRWIDVWNTTSLPEALMNSYTIAPIAAVCTLILAMPTAYAFGRLEFPGKNIAQLLTLLPLVMPGFVIAIFFSSFLFSIGIYSKFFGILVGFIVLFLPYAIRILSVSFSQIRQDLIDAARDMGASPMSVFRTAILPIIKPGILASLIIVFIQSIEEFALAYILGSPDFITVPTILFSFLGYQFIRPNAAVVSLILVVPNVIMLLGLERLLKSASPATMIGKG